jgi:hypothetical protein
MKKTISLTLLIALNLYPIAGILFWGWDINFTFFTYLAETLILVIFATIKMLMSKHLWDRDSAKLNQHWMKMGRKQTILNLLAMLYVFTVVLFTLYLLPWQGDKPPFGVSLTSVDFDAILHFLLFSVLSHTVSFIVYYIIGQERTTLATSLIFKRVMIGRILPLFLTPFVIAFMISLNIRNSVAPVLIVFLLVALFDVLAHIKEHSQI